VYKFEQPKLEETIVEDSCSKKISGRRRKLRRKKGPGDLSEVHSAVRVLDAYLPERRTQHV